MQKTDETPHPRRLLTFATLVPLFLLARAVDVVAVRSAMGQTAQSPDNTMTGPSNLCVGVHDCHMPPHAYTLDDIDRMRAAERAMATTTVHCEPSADTICLGPTWASAYSYPPDSVVELRVQTDIAAGITPEDLERKITAKP